MIEESIRPLESFMRNLKQSVFATRVALIGVVVAASCLRQLSGAATPENTAAQKFKNIQVLKDTPADELIPTMQFISASLGVECEFCHVEREMDKDDKKSKKTAREMMRMMLAINQNNFSGQRQVTCNTCHRGTTRPESVPAISRDAIKPATAERAGDDDATRATWPSGDSVLEKYLQVAGGRAALEKVVTRVEKGKVLLGTGRELPIEIFAKAPDLRVSVMHTQNGDSVTGYNGHEGWQSTPARRLQEMSAAEQYAAKLDATVMFPGHLSGMFTELKLQPQSEHIGEVATSVVWGFAQGRPPVKLYFDSQTGLLVRMVRYTDTALGLNPAQIDYADYRDAGGTKTPYRWTIARPNGAFTVQLDEVRDNAPIEATRFEEPARSPEDEPNKVSAH